MIKALIFDLDGVILDSMPAHVAAWQDAFLELGIEVEPDFFYHHEGALDRGCLTDMPLPNGRVLPLETFDQIMSNQRAIYLERYADSVRVFPGAARLVERLSVTPVRLALVTSSMRQVLKPDLWDWLAEHFSLIITGDQVNRNKPHPQPYLKALKGLGLEKGEVMVIENAPAGIEAARKAGLTCLALITTLPPHELAAADFIFGQHGELARWLEERLF